MQLQFALARHFPNPVHHIAGKRGTDHGARAYGNRTDSHGAFRGSDEWVCLAPAELPDCAMLESRLIRFGNVRDPVWRQGFEIVLPNISGAVAVRIRPVKAAAIEVDDRYDVTLPAEPGLPQNLKVERKQTDGSGEYYQPPTVRHAEWRLSQPCSYRDVPTIGPAGRSAPDGKSQG